MAVEASSCGPSRECHPHPSLSMVFPIILQQPPLPRTGPRGLPAMPGRDSGVHSCEKLLSERALWLLVVSAPTQLSTSPTLRMGRLSAWEPLRSPKRMIRRILFVKICLINTHLRSTKIITNKIHNVHHLQEGNTNLDK